MFKLPEKLSKQWLYIFIALFLLTFTSLFSVGKILDLSIKFENISGFAFLSLIVATILSAGGFLGAKGFFGVALGFNIVGIIYMLYVSVNKTAEGWSDLVSIISYLVTLGLGLFLGIITQSVMFFMSKKKQAG